ncbi:hypothetical protein ACFQ8C_18460 [Streptomyces sp. NPDC056503]|uniref:hypothetical protein n=1 Tax=Streptomyces sp. NPDC056503 TaxID=3345842 RepID=UPI00369CEFBB
MSAVGVGGRRRFMGGSGGTRVSVGPVARRPECDGGVLTVFRDGPVDPTSPPKCVVNVSSGSLDVEKVRAGAETSASPVLDVTPDQVHRVRITMRTAGGPGLRRIVRLRAVTGDGLDRGGHAHPCPDRRAGGDGVFSPAVASRPEAFDRRVCAGGIIRLIADISSFLVFFFLKRVDCSSSCA